MEFPFFGWIIVNMWKHSGFLYFDFVSCNFTEFKNYFYFFFWNVQGFLHMKLCHLQAEIISPLLLQFWCLLLLFFPTVLARKDHSTMLRSSGKSRQSCFIPNLRGKAFSFLLLSMMLTVHLSHVAFINFR